jgi:hypothetical protein
MNNASDPELLIYVEASFWGDMLPERMASSGAQIRYSSIEHIFMGVVKAKRVSLDLTPFTRSEDEEGGIWHAPLELLQLLREGTEKRQRTRLQMSSLAQSCCIAEIQVTRSSGPSSDLRRTERNTGTAPRSVARIRECMNAFDAGGRRSSFVMRPLRDVRRAAAVGSGVGDSPAIWRARTGYELSISAHLQASQPRDAAVQSSATPVATAALEEWRCRRAVETAGALWASSPAAYANRTAIRNTLTAHILEDGVSGEYRRYISSYLYCTLEGTTAGKKVVECNWKVGLTYATSS